jgi:hypothetical protein
MQVKTLVIFTFYYLDLTFPALIFAVMTTMKHTKRTKKQAG